MIDCLNSLLGMGLLLCMRTPLWVRSLLPHWQARNAWALGVLGCLVTAPLVGPAPVRAAVGGSPPGWADALEPACPGGARARALWAQGDRARALKQLAPASARGAVLAQCQAFIGALQLELGQFSTAAATLQGLDQALPGISDHLLYLRGKALLGAARGNPALLDQAVQVLSSIPRDSVMASRSVIMSSRAELDREQPLQALKRLESLYAGRPREQLSAEVLMLYGEAFQRSGKGDADAASCFRLVPLYQPLSNRVEDAEAALKALAARGIQVAPPTLKEQLARAQAYADAFLNEAAEARYLPLYERLVKLQEEARATGKPARDGATPELLCDAAFRLGSAQQNMRHYTDATGPLTTASEVCTDDRQVKALYRLTRGDVSKQARESAETRARTLIERFPAHSLADDALFLVGAAWQDEAAFDKARALYEEQIKTWPQGDMRAEAGWRLAWVAFRSGKLEDALASVEGTLQGSPYIPGPAAGQSGAANESPAGVREEKSGGGKPGRNRSAGAGQTDPGGEPEVPARLTREAYWRSRWLEILAQGRADSLKRAWEGYAHLAQAAPTDFYGMLAFSRLREVQPKRAAALASSAAVLAREPARPAKLERQSLSPALQTGLQLLDAGLLGQLDEALRPLIPGANDPPTPGGPAGEAALIGAILQKTHGYELSHRVVKRELERAGMLAPDPVTVTAWRLAFPLAFSSLVEQSAGAVSIDPMLLLSIAREESAFDPQIRSWAGAMGLTQLMQPTAERMAKLLDLPKPSSTDLLKPELNLTLGGAYLGLILGYFEGHPGLGVPSYNAGEGAVAKWLKQRPGRPFDEYVEEIPYKQTRDYVRRVLGTWQTYHYLYRKSSPYATVSFILPEGMNPKAGLKGQKSKAGGKSKASGKGQGGGKSRAGGKSKVSGKAKSTSGTRSSKSP